MAGSIYSKSTAKHGFKIALLEGHCTRGNRMIMQNEGVNLTTIHYSILCVHLQQIQKP